MYHCIPSKKKLFNFSTYSLNLIVLHSCQNRFRCIDRHHCLELLLVPSAIWEKNPLKSTGVVQLFLNGSDIGCLHANMFFEIIIFHVNYRLSSQWTCCCVSCATIVNVLLQTWGSSSVKPFLHRLKRSQPHSLHRVTITAQAQSYFLSEMHF